MSGLEGRLPHTLLPLALAVTLVRSKIANGASPVATNSNAMATFIAATVPIWEYSDDSRQLCKLLRNPLGDGIFRNGGRELHFLDGRPAKVFLAVQVDDVNCVIEMLQHPDRAILIRNRVLRALARRLVERTQDAIGNSRKLRGAARQLRDRVDALGTNKPTQKPQPATWQAK